MSLSIIHRDELGYVNEPGIPGDTPSIMIDDPEDAGRLFCIGFEYQGGDLTSPDSYVFDEVNHFFKGTLLYVSVDYAELNIILGRLGSSVRQVLFRALNEHYHDIRKEEA